MELLNHLKDQYVPCDYTIFELTPPIFHEHASTFYEEMGSPAITIDTFWHSYCQLLQCFFDVTNPDQPLASVLAGHFGTIDLVNEENVALLPGMKELRHGGKVIEDDKDVGNKSDPKYAVFTSDSESE